jgi:hypothetical protein
MSVTVQIITGLYLAYLIIGSLENDFFVIFCVSECYGELFMKLLIKRIVLSRIDIVIG